MDVLQQIIHSQANYRINVFKNDLSQNYDLISSIVIFVVGILGITKKDMVILHYANSRLVPQ